MKRVWQSKKSNRGLHNGYWSIFATKFEAFDGRGQNDYLISRDMEDIVTVLDGRSEIVEEVKNTEKHLNAFLIKRLAGLLENRDFLEALPGHLPPDPVNQARVDLIVERIKNMIED